MKYSILNTINQFKDNLIKAGELAVREILCTSYTVEIDDITFNIDYDETKQMYATYDCAIVFNYGNPNGEPWYRGKKISINTIPEYKLDDINYLYGLFYGYFIALE